MKDLKRERESSRSASAGACAKRSVVILCSQSHYASVIRKEALDPVETSVEERAVLHGQHRGGDSAADVGRGAEY